MVRIPDIKKRSCVSLNIRFTAVTGIVVPQTKKLSKCAKQLFDDLNPRIKFPKTLNDGFQR